MNALKRLIALLLVICIFACVFAGCGSAPEPAPAEITPTVEPTPEPTPEPTHEPSPEPTVEYDAKTQTVCVTGVTDWSALAFPDEIKSARVLEVYGDGFELHVYLDMLRLQGLEDESALPGLVYRTEAGLAFVRDYLRENAGDAYPSELAELPLVVRIDNPYGYKLEDDRLTLRYNELGTHREFEYVLALMDGLAIGWEQLGFAWYVGTCLCPYTEAADVWLMTPELPYYPQCVAGGIDPENFTYADMRTCYDACARYGFDKGLTHWGSLCESWPVTAEPDFSRKMHPEPGDELLSAFSAASFLAWLDEAHGFEAVGAFCFGKKTFDEAFGTDFHMAYKSWRDYITSTYPAA